MRLLKLIIITTFTVFSAHAKNSYVAKSGLDSNVGTPQSPFLTISKGVSSLKAGDTLFIKEGTYNERVEIKVSGVDGADIVVTNYKDDTVIVDGTDIKWWDWNGLFDISGQSYLVISGIAVKNAKSYGAIWIEKSDHIKISNCETYNSFSSGISCWECNNIIIDSNTVELACNDGGQECISVVTSSICTVSNNTIHNNGAGTEGGEGIDVKQGSYSVKVFNNTVYNLHNRTGLYVDAWDSYTHDIDLYNNTVYDIDNSGISVATEMGGLLKGVNIYNNIVYNCKYGGIEVGGWSAEDTVSANPIEDIKIINNTVFSNQDGIISDNKDAKRVVIRNNICSQNSGGQIFVIATPTEEVTISNNLIDSFRGWENEVKGESPILEPAQFIDTSIFDFRLKAGSHAIDNGTSTDAPQLDIIGVARPQGDKIDIGAYEYKKTSAISPSTNTSSPISHIFHYRGGEAILQFSSTIRSNYTLSIYSPTGKRISVSRGYTESRRVIANVSLAKGIYLYKVELGFTSTTIKGRFVV